MSKDALWLALAIAVSVAVYKTVVLAEKERDHVRQLGDVAREYDRGLRMVSDDQA